MWAQLFGKKERRQKTKQISREQVATELLTCMLITEADQLPLKHNRYKMEGQAYVTRFIVLIMLQCFAAFQHKDKKSYPKNPFFSWWILKIVKRSE